MILNWKTILIKIVCILLFIFIFYKLTESSWDKNYSDIETFENKIENEKINYIKLKETYIDQKNTSLDLLYANYSGEETGHDVWENKTLDQCTDICNNIEGCVGFTRDLTLDTEPSKCYPHNVINNCYSNRKGDLPQMQNAIKYNSFVKSNVSNILNTCIGDPELTLKRTIFIKSYSMPKFCLGISEDSRIMIIAKNSANFKSSCNFRIVSGNDGIGTVSFLHINTGKYIYRDSSNNLILYDIKSGSTENNQRSSFNLYDSKVGSGSVMIKAMSIEGETTEKFIKLDGNYLIISILPNNKNENSSSIYNNFTFYITDSIIDSNIITNKNNIPINTNPINTIETSAIMPINTMIPNNMMPINTTMSEDMNPRNTSMSNMMSSSMMPNNTSMSSSMMPNSMMPNNTSMSNMMPNSMMSSSMMPSNTSMSNMMPNSMMSSSMMPNSMIPSNTSMSSSMNPEDMISDNTEMQENFTVSLDSSQNIPVYKNLFSKPTNFKLTDYLQDNYDKDNSLNYTSISNKYDDAFISNQLSTSVNRNLTHYNSIYKLNLEIEKEIANLNLGLNAKNDKLVYGLDKMKITDMANDYFFLKNISNKK